MAWPPQPKLVTLDLNNVPLREAVKQIINASNASIIILGEIPMEPKVTLRLRDAYPASALSLIAKLGRLDFDSYTDGYQSVSVIAPKPDVLFPQAEGRSAGRTIVGGGPGSIEWRPFLPAPALPEESTGLTADLQVKDAPLAEVIAALNSQIPAERGVQVLVDESAPKDLRVTARFHKMPIPWILTNIVEQTGPTFGVQSSPDPQIVAAINKRFEGGMMTTQQRQEEMAHTLRVYTVTIVPKPELQVTGGNGGGGSGGTVSDSAGLARVSSNIQGVRQPAGALHS